MIFTRYRATITPGMLSGSQEYTGGTIPEFPYVYRYLSAALGALFYHIIPLVHFSNLAPGISPFI